MATIYLTCARKNWHYGVPDGWTETHFERFSFIECGIFKKPDADLTADDRQWARDHGERPEEWVEPGRRQPDPPGCTPTETTPAPSATGGEAER